MKSIFISTCIMFSMIVSAQAAERSSRVKREEPPVADRAFEKRLAVPTKYITRKGDTLKSVAGLVYGHSTWWPKLKKLNPKFKKTKPDQVLEIGTRIDYKRPKVTNNYVVQPNDCLIRIAEWKFGASDQWEAIFAKNKGIIKHPDFIRVGDHLLIKKNGMITHEKTGRMVMKPVTEEAPVVVESTPTAMTTPQQLEAAVTPAQVDVNAMATPARDPADQNQSDAMLGDPRLITLGFLVGSIFIIAFYFAYQRRPVPQTRFEKYEDYTHSERSDGPIDVVHQHTPPNPRVDVENQLPEVQLDMDGDLDELNKQGYHSLFKKRLKKYLGRR